MEINLLNFSQESQFKILTVIFIYRKGQGKTESLAQLCRVEQRFPRTSGQTEGD